MSCNTCETKFSFFTRENGCPSCGFSYCNKCLRYKYNLPNIGAKKICGRCYNKLKAADQKKVDTVPREESPPEGLDEPLIPVDITKKLEILENPAKPPIVMYKRGGHWDRLKKGLEPIDQEIVDRLKKLKDEDKQVPLPSVEEMKRRLALLKDQDPDKHDNINIEKVDTRTDQQKTNDLIQEYLERLQLSSGTDPYSEIQARLNLLRDKDCAHVLPKKTDDADDDDEEAITKKIIKKALSEAALEAKYQDVDELEEMEIEARQDSCDELEGPSCVMCEKSTQLVRCSGCNGDLYCPSCFEENHDYFELKNHTSVPFNRVEKSSPD